MADAKPEESDVAAAVYATMRSVMPPPPADPVEFPHLVTLALGVVLGRLVGSGAIEKAYGEAAFWRLSQLTPPEMVAAIWPPE